MSDSTKTTIAVVHVQVGYGWAWVASREGDVFHLAEDTAVTLDGAPGTAEDASWWFRAKYSADTPVFADVVADRLTAVRSIAFRSAK